MDKESVRRSSIPRQMEIVAARGLPRWLSGQVRPLAPARPGNPPLGRATHARVAHGVLRSDCCATPAHPGTTSDEGVIHVRLPPGCERHQVPGVRVHTQLLRDDEVMTLGPFTLTSPLRTVLEHHMNSRREVAVSALDSALNKKLLISPDDVEEMRRRAFGRRGAEIAASWWKLADGRAESPLESRTRLIVTDADMPPDELQFPVRDKQGILLGYGDLAWRRRGRRTLILETDGREIHDRPDGALPRSPPRQRLHDDR